MCMDMFVQAVSEDAAADAAEEQMLVRRVHHNGFMIEVHRRLHAHSSRHQQRCDSADGAAASGGETSMGAWAVSRLVSQAEEGAEGAEDAQ